MPIHLYNFCIIVVVAGWKQPLAEMQGKAAYIRPKVVRPFPGHYASGSYVHLAALFFIVVVVGFIFVIW
jgi:hypothetical protein